jgi:haloalkane dehalogenase
MPEQFPGYPAARHWFDRGDGIRMHYLDEGPRNADPVVMVHGNPSWSYYFRRLVSALSDRYRCIVPDHVGMGLSDKPGDADYVYTLQSRIDDLGRLLGHLGVRERVTLVVHDWGGMIGFGWALRMPAAVRRLVILNTAAFPLPEGKRIPWQLKLVRDSKLGALLVRGFNAFSSGASVFGVARRLPSAERRALVAPYGTWRDRIATLRFVQDIPLDAGDRAWGPVAEAGRRLHEFADRPALVCWGLRDFVFDRGFLDGFRERLPQAEVHAFEDAGHYVLEDAHERIVPLVLDFLARHPLD